MSQVIVTHDSLEGRRRQSAEQEQKISKEIMLHRRMSDPTKKDPVATAIGIMALPILAAWIGISFFIFLVTSLFVT